MPLLIVVFMISCTAQGRLSSRLTAEWEIEKYESRTADESTTAIENAGSIVFRSNGRGTQSFATAIAHAGETSGSDFTWTNTSQTVSIKSPETEYPKVWIVVESGRNTQKWYSTDSRGNVQIMHLKKK